MIFYKILPGKSQPEDEDDEEDHSIIRLLSGRYIFANGQSLGGTQSVDVLFLKLNTSLFIIIMFTTIHHHRSNGSRTNPHDTRTRRKPTELQRELIICVVLGIKVTRSNIVEKHSKSRSACCPCHSANIINLFTVESCIYSYMNDCSP